MRRLLILFLLLQSNLSLAQTVKECVDAVSVDVSSNYCSQNGDYNNTNSKKAKWIKFTATAFDVTINVNGQNSGGTLVAPDIHLYDDCTGTNLVGNLVSENNVTTFYKGGLIIGHTYYIKITGQNNDTGTFKICINNFDPVLKAGQDCSSASFLCTTQTISQTNVIGAGLDNNEAKGTCLNADGQSTESNSVWYKWQAANNGTLVFTITPNSTNDDIDWVLFDLGTSGDCSAVNPATAIRCKAGYGVDNKDCPGDPIYYKTGLDFKEIDLSEPPGCGKGQNGKLQFVNSIKGHYYALLINNFSSGNNGFTLAFTDQDDKPGTVEFEGPTPQFSYTGTSDCLNSPIFTFTSQSTNYDALKWSFGDGADVQTANTPGPHIITYNTAGLKTITLEATGQGGCTVVTSKQIAVAIKPVKPVITIDKSIYCIGDTVKLSASELPDITYSWTGPNNFHSTSPTAIVPVTGNEIAGTYTLVTSSFSCESDPDITVLATPLPTPTAAFHASPSAVNALYGPVTIQFINDTFNADNYLWDFGDGTISRDKSPSHVYNKKGDFSVVLTASRNNSCQISVSKDNLVIIQNNSYIFIPNSFTPNGDGINDYFFVTMTNIKKYHISVFSRWGQLLFESVDIGTSWDGNFNGKPAAFGVYYYVITATDIADLPIQRSGYITLLR